MAFPKHMSATEQMIVEKIIRKALSEDLSISVFDGMFWALKQSQDFEKISAEVNATDVTELRFRDSDKTILGSVILIHGNDEDVVHDHTDTPRLHALLQ